MKEKINKFHLYLQNVSTIKFILIMEIFLSFMMLSIFPFYHIYLSQIDVQKNKLFITNFLQENNFIIVAIGVAIIVQLCAILIKTLICQHWVIKFLSSIKIFKSKTMLTGIISVLTYTIIYFCCPKQIVYDYFVLNVVFIIYRILLGVVLAYTYIIYQEKDCSAY